MTTLTMSLTVAEVELFFTEVNQMALPNRTWTKLQDEGIRTPGDLVDFDEKTLKQAADNVRKHHSSNVAQVAAGEGQGVVGKEEPYVFSALSLKKMQETAELLRFYQTIGREVDADSIKYNITKDFTEQWEALKQRKEAKEADVPKITKAMPVIKWIEAFDDFLNRTVGVRNIPLAYVTRIDATPGVLPERSEDRAHSFDKSVIEDLVDNASHKHARYNDDNSKVYYFLEEATRGTECASALKPHQKKKDGRKAYLSIMSQYAGKDKWEAEIAKQVAIISHSKWKGQSNFPLDKFAALHRNAHLSLMQCAEHIPFQLSNERTRVTNFLNAIESTDHKLHAGLSLVEEDDTPDGKRNNFEKMVAFIVPKCPVTRKRTVTGKRDHEASISAMDGAEKTSSFGSKQGIGETGVHLRFYRMREYQALKPEQKAELKAWRESTNFKGQGKSSFKGKPKNFKNGKTMHPKFNNKAKANISASEKEKLREEREKDIEALVSAIERRSEHNAPAKKQRFDVASSQVQENQGQAGGLKAIISRIIP
jgi:hypothetical protein